MAIVSKFSHASATVELNDVNTGFSMAGDGWLPVVATPVYGGDPEPVVETIHLLLRDTSQNNIAADMQALHFMQVQADAYINDPNVDDPVWLHAKMANETGERRAVVYKIEVQYGASWYGDEATSIDIPVTLSVTRGPYWESTTARTCPTDSDTGELVFAYDYTASGAASASADAHDIVGDVGARIEFLRIESVTGESAQFRWIGARSASKHGTLANFVPVWELEDGQNGTDVDDAADTGASGGNRITVTESALEWDNTWQKICTFLFGVPTLGGNLTDNFGTFLMLLRLKVASGTWEVRFDYGTYTKKTGNIIEVDSTDYHLKEMGIFKFPVNDIKGVPSSVIDSVGCGGSGIDIYGRRTSGSGLLHLDCIFLIPVDEGFMKVSANAIGQVPIYIGQNPLNAFVSYLGTTASEVDSIITAPDNLNLPIGDGRLYIASAYSATAHTLTGNIIVAPTEIGTYYERWLSLRGSE